MIAIVDYGLGNLRSIAKALECVGGDTVVTNNHEEIQNADRIILPGVGAFGDGMQNLKKFKLIELLKDEVLKKKKPFWGICLGMQLLAKESEEFGSHKGLNWIDANVRKFNFPSEKKLKVPHMGWNTVNFVRNHPITSGLKNQEDFYFVHSYYVNPNDLVLPLGTCDYGVPFTACISKENIFATQFHPEKSQQKGLKMLANFIEWNP
ncbi:imidazole glycerol phosphate synthase subunit HisH [Patescibacteria group bacterium]|nr:imidazole glycerol phosphate synthase subunit HisH [Patescibacteria group bacterium]MBU1123645.1 imidazole glycerol phosphate synthase subunit HisH [Patescibacteria group bacterium]MBU1911530.1 imidazole glycerol phosphate synthase subunit HisH [Patescibacteria group bacterium]